METNKTIKTTFLRKFLVSIFGIEKYEQVAESTVPSFIKYLFILAIIASILIVPSIIQITVKATDTFQNFVNENLPNFEIVNNEFKLESNETIIRTNKTDFQKIIQGTIILTNENDIKSKHKELLEISGNVIILSKDYLYLKSSNNKYSKYTYNYLAEYMGLPKELKKSDIIKLLSEENQNKILQKTILILIIITIIISFGTLIINVLAISLVGYLITKISNIDIEYKKVFNISSMSITLASTVYLIIMITTILTNYNFVVPNVDLLYLVLSYIYLIIALMLIRNKGIKNQQELYIKETSTKEKIEEIKEIVREKKEDKENKKDEEKQTDENVTSDNT